MPITRWGTRLNQLFFFFLADDSLLFCKAKESKLRFIQQILDLYEKALGQKLNKEKTSIYFSHNTSADARRLLSWIVGVPPTQRYESHLGLLALVDISRTHSFEGLKGRIWDKMHG